jgi:hypothetical protein
MILFLPDAHGTIKRTRRDDLTIFRMSPAYFKYRAVMRLHHGCYEPELYCTVALTYLPTVIQLEIVCNIMNEILVIGFKPVNLLHDDGEVLERRLAATNKPSQVLVRSIGKKEMEHKNSKQKVCFATCPIGWQLTHLPLVCFNQGRPYWSTVC